MRDSFMQARLTPVGTEEFRRQKNLIRGLGEWRTTQ
jgi:hypothetical protein